MDVLMWASIGILVGLLARVIVPGEKTDGFIVDAIVGTVGGLLGGYMVSTVEIGHFLAAGLFWNAAFAFGGAATLVLVSRGLTAARSD